MKGEYTPPTFRGDGFNCPHCGVFAHQDWYDVSLENAPVDEEKEASDDLALSYCDKCGSYAVWIKDEMIFPQPSVVPLPLEEMPDDFTIDVAVSAGIDPPAGAGDEVVASSGIGQRRDVGSPSGDVEAEEQGDCQPRARALPEQRHSREPQQDVGHSES